MTVTALITGAGGPAGRALAAQFLDRGLTFAAVDMAPLDGMASPSFVVPPAASDRFLSRILSLVRQLRPRMVIPTVSEELPQMAALKNSLPGGSNIVVSGPGPTFLANDKLFTALRLRTRGVCVPRFGLPSEFAGTRDAFERLGRPVIVKPRVSRGARGVALVSAIGDLDLRDVPDSYIVQEFAPGPEYAPVVFRPEVAGQAKRMVAVLRKVRLTHGRVGNAMEVALDESASSVDVARTALAAVRALGVTGPADVDVRRSRDGTPVVLEINARFGANSSAAPELLSRVLCAYGVPSNKAVDCEPA